MPEFLTSQDVVALHDQVVLRSGGKYSPLTRPNELDSAVNSPKYLAIFEHDSTVVDLAVDFAVKLSLAHPFEDGNKRVALTATLMFLQINGFTFVGDSMVFACWLICIIGKVNIDDTDFVVGYLGFDLTCDLDGLGRRHVVDLFSDWLRGMVVPIGFVEES